MNLGQSEVIEQAAESSKTNEEPAEVVKMEVAEENNESVEEIEEIGLEDNFLDEPSSSSGASGIPINVFNVETKTESADFRLGFILVFSMKSLNSRLVSFSVLNVRVSIIRLQRSERVYNKDVKIYTMWYRLYRIARVITGKELVLRVAS